jgi:CheY-like chemotaxis protein
MNNKNYHLITDGNELNRLVVKILLEKNGIDVDDANSGKKTIDKVKANLEKYSIIWMDVDMYKMNGITCTKKLRDNLNFHGHIVGLTGHIDPDMIEECKQAGMNEVILKPITEEILKDYIKKSNTKLNNVHT